MLSAGIVSGAFRRMMDIVDKIDRNRFKVYVAYKPKYAKWGEYEIRTLQGTGAEIIPLRGKWLFDLRGYQDLWHTLKEENIDILHSWDVLGVPARILSKMAGSKIIEEFGNPPEVLHTEISLKHYVINKLTFIFVDGFVACSNEIIKRYQEREPVFLKNKLKQVIHNCVSVPDFTPPPETISSIKGKYHLSDHDLILTNTGYFNKQKAQWDLLHAFKIVSDMREDVRLFLIGWGELEKELRHLASRLGLGSRVIFTGKLDRSRVFEILSITDLFVLSSHWEGFGIVLAEAMAFGKPVVSTDTDGSREVVDNDKTGILVPPNQPSYLAKAILNLLGRPDMMAQMGEAGLKRVSNLFNCETFIRNYESFYRAVASTNR